MKEVIGKAKEFGSKIGKPVAKGLEKVKTVSAKIPIKRPRLKFGGWAAKVLAGLVIVLGLIQVVFAVLIYGFHQDNKAVRIASGIVPFPAAIVNGDVVSYRDYLTEKDYIHHFYAATKQENVGYDEVDTKILDQLIENRLINFQALRNGIKVNKDEIDSSVNSIVEQNGGQEKVEKVLEDYYGLNLSQFRELVRDQLIRDKVNNQLIAKVSVRHILVRVDKDAPADKVEEARKKVEGYKNEIAGGVDFAEEAKKNSEDIGSNEQGGQLDPFARGEMVKEFSDAAFSTPVGQISDPVRSEFGWHIIKVEARTGKIETTFNDWLAGLKSKSFIRNLV